MILSHEEFQHGVELKEKTNLATYRSYTGPTIEKWRPLRKAAVQMAAAAAAYARMHMDPIIRNNKSDYTDTDSVHPLPDELLSPSVLGKGKKEDWGTRKKDRPINIDSLDDIEAESSG